MRVFRKKTTLTGFENVIVVRIKKNEKKRASEKKENEKKKATVRFFFHTD
jgi:hypothetical protein